MYRAALCLMKTRQECEETKECDRRKNNPYSQLKCYMQIQNLNNPSVIAVDVHSGAVLPAWVLSNITEIGPAGFLHPGKEEVWERVRSVQTTAACAWLIFVVCFVAQDQSAPQEALPGARFA